MGKVLGKELITTAVVVGAGPRVVELVTTVLPPDDDPSTGKAFKPGAKPSSSGKLTCECALCDNNKITKIVNQIDGFILTTLSHL